MSLANARMDAALILLEHEANPWLDRPAVVSVGLQQLASAVSAVPQDKADWVPRAIQLANRALDAQQCESVASSAALVAESLSVASAARGDIMTEADRAAIRALLERAAHIQVACNPRSVRGWIRLADAAKAQGDIAAERSAALRALVADDSYELDPLRKLPEAERARLQRRAST
jgi:hypothetical protein